MRDYVFAERGPLEIVKKDAARPQARSFNLVGVDYIVKSGADFRSGVRSNQMKIVPIKGKPKRWGEKGGPRQQEHCGQRCYLGNSWHHWSLRLACDRFAQRRVGRWTSFYCTRAFGNGIT